ncbi:uncharacterized protein LOC107362790 [Tetranychus urticae]|uniref:uncharacterized protein LOC107362790 n=1 Tax=Tetranychus urticae TaxID=32264 RepID=UPI00077BF77A|nr:uncharacterized protein LOC107362790 [Tetranychus urticae]
MDKALINGVNGSSIGASHVMYDCMTGEHLKTIKRLVKKLKIKAGEESNGQVNQMYNSWIKLSLLCDYLYEIGSEYCHIDTVNRRRNGKGVNLSNGIHSSNNNRFSRYNGIKCLIKVVSKFVCHVEDALDNGFVSVGLSNPLSVSTSTYEVLHSITEMLIILLEILKTYFEDESPVETGAQATMYLLETYIKSREKLTEGIKAYWSHYPAFWLDEDAQWVSSFFSLISSSLSNLPYSLKSLVSRSAHGYWQEGLLYSASPYYPLNLANYVNNPFTSALNWVTCKYSGLAVKEIDVPRSTNWQIPCGGTEGDGKVRYVDKQSGDANLKPIKCRLINHAGKVPNGNVIFHCQGGAFTVELPAIFDQCFRHWVPYLEGGTIFDVTYSRFVRYPVQLQELLDVFLWLTNYETNDVQNTLGFIPKKIIFCGDSGGGLFLFSLSTILRDIQIIISSTPDGPPIAFPSHLYPKALVTFYPVLSLTFPSVQPSLVFSFLEQFLTPLAILNCLSLYSAGVIFDSDCENLDSFDSSRYLQPSRWQTFYNTWISKQNIWLQCDKEVLSERINAIVNSSLSPYKSPLIKYNLDLIKDLNIYLVVGEYDPFLDTNIEFAQRWPGKIVLDVIEDVGHGFLGLTWTSKKSTSAARLCLERILEALKD